jgi:oligopeptide/dipeptide ABC transporter ATP-binding protein
MTRDVVMRFDRVTAQYRRRGWWNAAQRPVTAVDGVSFEVMRGETLGLVGESGCGKSTLARLALALKPLDGGDISFEGRSFKHARGADLTRLRRDVQIVFQDPYASLDPRRTVGASVRAALDIHRIGTRRDRIRRVTEMLQKVGLSADLMERFPHEFSGGQRQRIGIARALIIEPKLLVCDEPVSALDVSIQAQILNLLSDLKRAFGLTTILISHNLAVVEHMSDRIAVMYAGRIVELAPRDELFNAPRHPYTKALIAAVPLPDPSRRLTPSSVSGDLPDSSHVQTGCRFRNRCPIAVARCVVDEPSLASVSSAHAAACWVTS